MGHIISSPLSQRDINEFNRILPLCPYDVHWYLFAFLSSSELDCFVGHVKKESDQSFLRQFHKKVCRYTRMDLPDEDSAVFQDMLTFQPYRCFTYTTDAVYLGPQPATPIECVGLPVAVQCGTLVEIVEEPRGKFAVRRHSAARVMV